MNKIPKISDAEWQVMKILWEKAPVTSSEIVENLRLKTGWSPTTIYTLINRLVKKKVVAIEKGSSPYLCKPLLSQKEYRSEARNSFLKKVYDGSLNLLLTNILEEEGLTEEEVAELKRILDNSKTKGR
ncbi:BlaI/MecI/CopY family transcriptional regulator [Paradesulfitobacterium ferrireducens]|uniref:BlaI/MecI/CopY family transcriptional regulator n=1 Tax=Paradesulfitobacterium ferrireducens TaxID=2816476 RepID=UPI001A8CC719|nr:BlaI/MecI/CopY family transcriptional regulator [Paradesulfitobacterium ferrireducens]